MFTFKTSLSIARRIACVCALTCAFAAQAQAGSGLRVRGLVEPAVRLTADGGQAPDVWSPWRGRLGIVLSDSGLGSSSSYRAWSSSTPIEGLKLHSLRLLGDYYFAPGTGFRATGGLMTGHWSSPWGPTANVSVAGLSATAHNRNTWLAPPGSPSTPANGSTSAYFGAGYSYDLAQTWGGNWSFSADLGLVALSSTDSAGVRLGRVFNGALSVEDWAHDLHFQPLLQLGFSYSF